MSTNQNTKSIKMRRENNSENTNQSHFQKKNKKNAQTQNTKENALNIYLRIRPLSKTERGECISFEDDSIILQPPNRGQAKKFTFKKVFGPECEQKEVFEQSIDNLLPVCADGRDLLFFAYGVTGAGKTFSIQGTDDNPGILPRTLVKILEMMKDGTNGFSEFTEMKVSCFEIFNEKIYDLLDVSYKTQKSSKLASKSQLNISRDNDGKTIVENVHEILVSDESQIKNLIETAKSERRIAATSFNRSSTRSHVIFRISLSRSTKKPVCISIVDLAGCERTKKLENSRIKESVNINKSMLVLGKCIRSLASHKQVIPYRESLITRLFKDFFESPGRCAVASVLVNVTPSLEQIEETSFSLSFAVDASNCSTTSSNDEDLPISQGPDPSFQLNLVMQTQKYLKNLDDAYKSQVDELMERTRSANLLITNLSEYVAIADYEALKKENMELRKQLNQALERIAELSK